MLCWKLLADNSIFQATAANPTLYRGPFRELAVGNGHVCNLSPRGAIACMGDNDAGQATPPRGDAYGELVVGSRHTCVLNDKG